MLDSEDKVYTISDLASEFSVTTRTIRFYEAQGLLHPKRQGTKRLFSRKDRVHLKLILRGKRLGFSLKECKDIIGLYNPAENNYQQTCALLEKITEKQQILVQQLEDIHIMEQELKNAENRCHDDIKKFELESSQELSSEILQPNIFSVQSQDQSSDSDREKMMAEHL